MHRGPAFKTCTQQDLNNYFLEGKRKPLLLLLLTDQVFKQLLMYLFNQSMYVSKSWIFQTRGKLTEFPEDVIPSSLRFRKPYGDSSLKRYKFKHYCSPLRKACRKIINHTQVMGQPIWPTKVQARQSQATFWTLVLVSLLFLCCLREKKKLTTSNQTSDHCATWHSKLLGDGVYWGLERKFWSGQLQLETYLYDPGYFI